MPDNIKIMKIEKTMVEEFAVYHVPCGFGILCSVSPDMSDPWLANDPSDEMPSDDVATDAEVDAAIEQIQTING